jgi:hypothetical protein
MDSGYVRKRLVKGSVVYAICVAIRDPRTGELREQVCGRYRTKREAVAALAKWEQEQRSGGDEER